MCVEVCVSHTHRQTDTAVCVYSTESLIQMQIWLWKSTKRCTCFPREALWVLVSGLSVMGPPHIAAQPVSLLMKGLLVLISGLEI